MLKQDDINPNIEYNRPKSPEEVIFKSVPYYDFSHSIASIL